MKLVEILFLGESFSGFLHQVSEKELLNLAHKEEIDGPLKVQVSDSGSYLTCTMTSEEGYQINLFGPTRPATWMEGEEA